jgi:hypothetical protein
VSGETPAQDEEIALAGASAVKDLTATETEASLGHVTYFDKEKVAESFAQGAVLFNRNETYMVHTSRRDQAGVAEVHTKDADIIYVQDGSATFVERVSNAAEHSRHLATNDGDTLRAWTHSFSFDRA